MKIIVKTKITTKKKVSARPSKGTVQNPHSENRTTHTVSSLSATALFPQ